MEQVLVLGIGDVDGNLLLSQLLNGLALGVLYVLMASGLSVIFGITDILNFAHGVLYMLGAYLAFAVIGATGNFFVALLVAPILVGLFGATVERSTLNRIYDRGPLYHILLTFGLVLIVTDLVRLIWGSQPKLVTTPELLAGTVQLGPIAYPEFRLFSIVAGSVLAVSTWALFRFTRFGLIARAGAQDQQTVRLLGVDMSRYFTLVFALGALLAGAAGALAAPFLGVDPDPANAETISDWARDYWEAVHPHSEEGAYVNFMMEEGQDRIKATYGDNYPRLQKVKAKYDPDNFFRVNQNIDPG
jgi:branched-chain amino acid transport system permease protein